VSRRYTETDRLKFGSMKAVYYHTEYDDQGHVVGAWISCSTKHLGTDFERLMEDISNRIQGLIAKRVEGGRE
jgi:hypothetical protein